MGDSLMTTSKRKIKAKAFVRDLRTGMDDKELMETYALSESQLHKVFHELVDAAVIDEMELFMRTYLSDGFMSGAMVGAQTAKEEIGHRKKTTSLPDLETPSDDTVMEKVSSTSGVFRRMLSKLGRTGS